MTETELRNLSARLNGRTFSPADVEQLALLLELLAPLAPALEPFLTAQFRQRVNQRPEANWRRMADALADALRSLRERRTLSAEITADRLLANHALLSGSDPL